MIVIQSYYKINRFVQTSTIDMKKLVDIDLIMPNDGQIPGLPANPRLIKDARYEKLKNSIKEDPEMLEYRGLLVIPFHQKYIAIGGNMRLRAALELGFKQMPCEIVPEDTPIEKLMAYTIKDNIGYGEWDLDMIANEWPVQDLDSWGFEFPVELPEDKDEKIQGSGTKTKLILEYTSEDFDAIVSALDSMDGTNEEIIYRLLVG